MEFGPVGGPIVIMLIVIGNAFFVGSEMALVASRRNRLEQKAQEGNANAAAALRITGQLDRYIAACQFGVTLASLGLGWVGEPVISQLIEGLFDPTPAIAAYVPTHVVTSVVAFSVITSMHIVLGELVPKSLSLQRSETIIMLCARPLTAFAVVFGWPVAALTWVGNAVLRSIGLEPASGHEMVHSVAELRLLVTGSQRAGVVEESEARIVARAFSFADITAGMVMTPRTSIEAVPIDASREDVVARLVASGRRRLPVYEGSLDNVQGIVHARDIMADLAQGGHFDLRTIVRPVVVVPESKGIDELLDELRSARDKVAIVLDEYGGTAGLVTLPDLVEPLVGRFQDDRPTRVSSDAPGKPAVNDARNGNGTAAVSGSARSTDAPHADGSTTTDGMTRLTEWELEWGTSLTDNDRAVADTLGGLVMARLGRLPEVGDCVVIGGHLVTVEAMDGRRVDRVQVKRTGTPRAR
jgi:CBS domain containing-hemolysin-like protein